MTNKKKKNQFSTLRPDLSLFCLYLYRMTGTFSVARWMVKFVSGTFLTRKWLCGMRSKAQVRSIRSTHVGGGGGVFYGSSWKDLRKKIVSV